jgi:phage shock protein B
MPNIDIAHLAIIMVFAIPLTAILCSFFIEALKILRGDRRSRKTAESPKEETEMIQAIYRGLAEMEKRIESLETLLLDHTREDVNR